MKVSKLHVYGSSRSVVVVRKRLHLTKLLIRFLPLVLCLFGFIFSDTQLTNFYKIYKFIWKSNVYCHFLIDCNRSRKGRVTLPSPRMLETLTEEAASLCCRNNLHWCSHLKQLHYWKKIQDAGFLDDLRWWRCFNVHDAASEWQGSTTPLAFSGNAGGLIRTFKRIDVDNLFIRAASFHRKSMVPFSFVLISHAGFFYGGIKNAFDFSKSQEVLRTNFRV